MDQLTIGIGAIIFVYLLIYKPSYALVVFFTLTIAAINFDIPGSGTRFRPILGGLLLLRSAFHSRILPIDFVRLPVYRLMLIFFGYILLLSWGKETLQGEITRLLLLSLVTAYLGYYAFKLGNGAGILKASIIFAGLICFADLAYTYKFIGHFPVQRIYHLFFPNYNELEELNDTNHNFYGFICGISLVLLLSEHLNARSGWARIAWLLMPLMLLGVLMSTSRSTLLGLIVAAAYLIYRGLRDPLSRKRTAGILSFSGITLAIVLFAFVTLQSFFELDSEFLDNISFRLVEEPMAVVRKNLGYEYNVQNLDAMDWRKESAALALEAYGRLRIDEQITGVGIGGYLKRNLGQNGLNPHNGILYILVESGLIGFLLYFSMIWIVIRNAFRARPVSALVLVLIFIIFYSLGQNEELISATAMLFVSTLAAENASMVEEPAAVDIPITNKSLRAV